MRPGRPAAQAIGAGVALVAATVALVVVLAPDEQEGPAPPTTTTIDPVVVEASVWSEALRPTLEPLVEVLPALVDDLRGWREGEVADEDLQASLAAWRGIVDGVATDLERLDPLRGAPVVLAAYQRSVDLYAAAIEVAGAATRTAEPALKEQLGIQAGRLRILGDRVFDRGGLALATIAPEPLDPLIEVRLPEEVPYWPSEQLAAGPPLTEQPPEPAELFPTRVDERPTDRRERWLEAIDEADPPTPAAVAAALHQREPGSLDMLADRSIAAAEHLRQAADPVGEGGREEGARFRLGVLVLAEAARAGQVAALLDASGPVAALDDVARSLVDVTADDVFGVPERPRHRDASEGS